MDNENPTTPQEKGKRLTKEQSVILLIGALVAWVISASFVGSTLLNAAATTTFIFALVSLFTKNGLRWK